MTHRNQRQRLRLCVPVTPRLPVACPLPGLFATCRICSSASGPCPDIVDSRRSGPIVPSGRHHTPNGTPEKSIEPAASPPRPRSVQPSFCGGYAPQKLLLRSLALTSLDHTCRDLVPTFPQRSPPRLLTAAACGGLGSAT